MEKKLQYILLAVLLVGVVLLVIGLSLGLTHTTCQDDTDSGDSTGFYKYGAVSSDNQICSTVGTQILARHGGSATDAAIATLLCLGVVNSQHVGIGGGHLMVLNERPRNTTERELKSLIARSTAPLWVRPEYFDNDPEERRRGALSIAVPCELKGYSVAWERYGRVPWRKLFEPSIKLASEGWPVSQSMADSIQSSLDVIQEDSALSEAYLKEDGSPYQAGDVMTAPKLARTLQRIAEEGADTFYTGSLARDIVDDIEDMGGRMSFDDMASSKVLIWAPIDVSLRNGSYRLLVSPPPSSGATVAFILKILDQLSWALPDGYDWDMAARADTLHKMIEAWGMAFSLRNRAIGDKAFQTRDMIEWLEKFADKDYAEEVADLIGSRHVLEDLTVKRNEKYQEMTSQGGTTHVNVLSAEGGAVSVTSTVNSMFGSHVRGNRTGIIFNNDLALFDLPSETKLSVNIMYPRKRGRSSTSPIMVLDDDNRVVMLTGSSGGSRIITSTAFVLAHTLLLGQDASYANSQPRVHAEFNTTLYYDKELPQAILDKLSEMGHTSQLAGDEMFPYLGINQVIDNRACLACGDSCSEACIEAVSDWRKGGQPDGY